MLKGRDINTAPPLQRWDTDSYYSPLKGDGSSIYARSGCYLDQISDFDVQLFRSTKAEALYFDPHARLLLEHSQVSAAENQVWELFCVM